MKKPYFDKSFFLVILLTLAIWEFAFSQTFTNQSNELLNNTDFHSGVAIAIADMNGDSLDDIIHLDNARDLFIEYQLPGGEGFDTYEFGNVSSDGQWSIAVADVDHDGRYDILAGGAYDGVKIIKYDKTDGEYKSDMLPGPGMFIQGSNFADINNDGFLDIFACHDDAESRIWANDGNGGFAQSDDWIDMATTPSSDNSGNYGSIWTDFDNDGDQDLYIAKCRQGVNDQTDPRRINALYVNDGNNNFTEQADEYGLKIGYQSWTSDFQDIDNDGDMDCFITNHDFSSQLLENDGTGHFTDITEDSGIRVEGLPIQGVMRDFDNDGFVDVLIAGTEEYLYHNNGDKSFTLIDKPSGLTEDMESYGLGDLNHDGFLDIYAGYANVFNGPSSTDDALLINNGNDNNFVCFMLEGTISNRNGIGARVEIYGEWGVQVREVRAGESYGINNSHKAHFGLGQATSIDKLLIRWPSGIVQSIDNPAINQFTRIQEVDCVLDNVVIDIDGETIFCDGESVLLTTMEGTSYLWSNGDTTQSITVTEPGNYYVFVGDAEGCFGRSDVVVLEKNPEEFPSIIVEGEAVFCEGGSVVLTAADGTEYTWSNGATTTSITVSEAGEYFVTNEGQCADFNSETIEVQAIPYAETPTAEGASIPTPGEITLTSSGTNPRWYDAATGGTLLHEGTVYTPTIQETTTFYVEDVNMFGMGTQYTGQPDHTGASLYSGGNFNGQMLFEVLEPCKLLSIKAYTDAEGERIIELYSEQGDLLNSQMANIPVGESRVELDFELTPGKYYLTTNSDQNFNLLGTESPRLQRSNEGVNYPYDIQGLISVYDSNYGTDYYYYFYDWEVREPTAECASDRVAVLAEVGPTGTDDINLSQSARLFPNPAQNAVVLEWLAPVQAGIQLSILDAQGRLVRQLDLDARQQQTIDLSGLAKGLYLLRLKNEDRVMSGKIVLQ